MVWQKEKIRILEAIAEAWTAADVSWAVCNGLDGYPEKVGRDLDVLTSPDDVQRAASITVNVLREQGFCPLPFRLGWIYWIVGIRKVGNELYSLQVDLFDHLQWAFTWVVDGALPPMEEQEKMGPFFVDPRARVGKRLVINLLSGNVSLFEERPHYLDLTEPEAAVLPVIFERISGCRNSPLLEAIAQKDFNQIRSLIPVLRRKVLAHSCIPSKGFRKRLKSAFQKQWNMNLFPRPSVPILAVQSSDDSRSKDVCEELVQLFSERFVLCGSELLDQRPRFLFRKSEGFGILAVIDFLGGTYFRINKMSALQSIEIYCGHAFSLNEHEDVTGLKRWLLQIIPKPDINIYLTVGNEELDLSALCRNFGITDVLAGEDLENAASIIFSQFIRSFCAKSESQCALLAQDRL